MDVDDAQFDVNEYSLSDQGLQPRQKDLAQFKHNLQDNQNTAKAKKADYDACVR